MVRPFAVIGISFFIALLCVSFIPLNAAVALGVLGLCAFLCSLFSEALRKSKYILAVLLSVTAACFAYAAADIVSWRPLRQWDGRTAQITVETLDFVEGGLVRAKVLDGELPAGTSLTLWLSGRELYPRPYDRLTGSFVLHTPDDTEIDPVTGNIRAGKAFLYAYAEQYGEEGLTLESPDSPPPMYQILRLRRYIRMTIMSRPELGSYAGLLGGITFGFVSDISPSVKSDFNIAGVSHLLAVSGMHTTLIAHLLLSLLLRLKTPRPLAACVSVVGILLFMALTGFSASVMRSGIMSIILMLGMTIGRKPDSLNSLGIAILAVTLFDPYAINDVGLLLSFAAAFGIITLLPALTRATSLRLRGRGGIFRGLAVVSDMVCVTAAATIPTLPIMFAVFGTVSLVSPLANILMVEPSFGVMLLGFIGVVLAPVPFLQPVAAFVFGLAKWLCAYLAGTASLLASLPFAAASADKPYLMMWFFGSALMFLLTRCLWKSEYRLRFLTMWSIIALLCGVLAEQLVMHGVTEITVMGSGGDAVVMLTRGSLTGAVVMGSGQGCETLYYEMRRTGRRSLDILLFPDTGGETIYVPELFADYVKAVKVITGNPETVSLPAAGTKRLEYERALSWDGSTLAFWEDSAIRRSNGWIMVTLEQTRMLICPRGGNAGDIGADDIIGDDMKKTNLAVFCGEPPGLSEMLTATAAISAADRKILPLIDRQLLRQEYPAYHTASGNIKVQTRGKGDLHLRNIKPRY